MSPADMERLREAVVAAALAWFRVPQAPPARWCEVAEQFEVAADELCCACAELDAAQMSERGAP